MTQYTTETKPLSLAHRPDRDVAVIVCSMLVVMAWAMGCDPGCGDRDGDLSEISEEAVELTDQQVAAVVRIADFDRAHFDAQHWIAEGVEAGVFRGRENLEHGIPEVPTEQLKDFVEKAVGDASSQLNWEAGVDVVLWTSRGGDWRWSIRISTLEYLDLQRDDDWTAQARHEDSSIIYRRQLEDKTPLYGVSEVSEKAGATVTLANVAAAPVAVDEALHLTGDSGRRAAELYLWPHRADIPRRFEEIAAVTEHKLSIGAHGMPAPRMGLFQLIAQLHHALGRPEAWPRLIRVATTIDRDAQTGGAESVELFADVRADDGQLLPLLYELADSDSGTRRSRLADSTAQFDLDLESAAIQQLIGKAVPDNWWSVVTGRGSKELESLLASVDGLSAGAGAPVTFALFDSPLPQDNSGEVFVAVETQQPEEFADSIHLFSDWLIREYWLGLLELDSDVHERTEQVEINGDAVELTEQVFVIGHGFGVGGVCHGDHGGEFVAYFGVGACERLVEILETGWEREPASALSYRGRLQGVVDALMTIPDQQVQPLFGDIELDVSVQPTDPEHLRVSVSFDDLTELARLLDGVPQLGRDWRNDQLVNTDELDEPLPLDVPVYQEPSLAVVGMPGAGFGLTGAFVLGMPFSYPPVSPRAFRQFFFAAPGEEPGHHHHHHDH